MSENKNELKFHQILLGLNSVLRGNTYPCDSLFYSFFMKYDLFLKYNIYINFVITHGVFKNSVYWRLTVIIIPIFIWLQRCFFIRPARAARLII